MPNGAFSDKVQRWDVLVKSLIANAPDLPNAADDVKQLQDLLQRARDMRKQQDTSQAQFRTDVKAQQALILEGEKLRTRIVHSIKGKYGPEAAKLYEFGMRPIRARKSKKQAPPDGSGGKPEPPTATPAQPAAAHPTAPAAEPPAK